MIAALVLLLVASGGQQTVFQQEFNRCMFDEPTFESAPNQAAICTWVLARIGEHRPSQAAVYARRAEMYRIMRRTSAARADLDRALELWPDAYLIIAARGDLAYELENDLDGAFRYWDRAIAIDPAARTNNYAYALMTRGRAFEQAFEFQRAIRDYELAKKVGGSRFDGHRDVDIDYARALRRSQQPDRADSVLADYFRWDEQRGDIDVALTTEVAAIRLYQNRAAEALRLLNRALAAEPNNGAALYLRGYTIQSLGTDIDQATADMARGRELDRSAVIAFTRLDMFGEIHRPGPTPTPDPLPAPTTRSTAPSTSPPALVGTWRVESLAVPENFRRVWPFLAVAIIGLAVLLRELKR